MRFNYYRSKGDCHNMLRPHRDVRGHTGWLITGSFVAALMLGSSLAAAQQPPQAPPPVVTVTMVQPESVMLTARLPGRIVAAAVAEVRPQVSGIITERFFEEGGSVKKGDVLYAIDPASYEAAVAQSEAAVAQAEARFKAADRESQRIQTLAKRNVAAQSELDDAIAARDVAAATIGVAKAQRKAALIELDRTRITASLSGEIGRAMTTQGALVSSAQSDPLAVIRNIDTVFVDVTASATNVLKWRRKRLGSDWRDIERQVTLYLADNEPYSHTGLLTAAEPHVDIQTGVVVLRMEFPNPDKLLLPGTYVRVDVQTDLVDDVFVLSQQAVGRDRQGRPIALVVNADDIVEERQLTVIQARDSDWIVQAGLNAGDRVILEGRQKAAPGTTVRAEARRDDSADGSDAGDSAESTAKPAKDA